MGDIERELTVFVVLLRNVFVCNGKMVCFFSYTFIELCSCFERKFCSTKENYVHNT